MEVRVAGKVREMEARVLFNPASRLIPYDLAETPGMPGDAPDGTRLGFTRAWRSVYEGFEGL